MYTHSGPLTKGQRGHGRQYINTQDLYPNVRGRWETVYRHSAPLSKGQSGGGRQCTHTQHLYLEVRGEVGDSVQTLTISI